MSPRKQSRTDSKGFKNGEKPSRANRNPLSKTPKYHNRGGRSTHHKHAATCTMWAGLSVCSHTKVGWSASRRSSHCQHKPNSKLSLGCSLKHRYQNSSSHVRTPSHKHVCQHAAFTLKTGPGLTTLRSTRRSQTTARQIGCPSAFLCGAAALCAAALRQDCGSPAVCTMCAACEPVCVHAGAWPYVCGQARAYGIVCVARGVGWGAGLCVW